MKQVQAAADGSGAEGSNMFKVSFNVGRMLKDRKGSPMFRVTQLFFDKPTVQRALDSRTRYVFARFGAFVRNAARWSMKKAPKRRWVTRFGVKMTESVTSKPGKPPYARLGLIKRFLFYSLDPSRRSVVIGPVRTNAKSINVPHVLEYGGRSKAMQFTSKKKFEYKSVTVRARPFMRPAFEKGKGQLRMLWQHSVK
ncbi:MAG: hypothetical protein PHH26_05560 [Candidatus Thermoplasmatota archaeon]|nr:hypothetical protein [Candidatus Thermoplasmatota archaeon]